MFGLHNFPLLRRLLTERNSTKSSLRSKYNDMIKHGKRDVIIVDGRVMFASPLILVNVHFICPTSLYSLLWVIKSSISPIRRASGVQRS